MTNVPLFSDNSQGNRSAGSRVLDFLLNNWLYTVTIILFVLYALVVPRFLSVENMRNLIIGASITGIATAGFMIALVAGQIDASIAGIVALTAAIAAFLFVRVGVPFPLTFVLVLGSAALIGLFNSFLIVEAKIFSLVATIATTGLFIGLALFITGGQVIGISRIGFSETLLARPLGIPVSIWLLIFVYIFGYTTLNQTKLGAHLYATGANYDAARLAGVPVKRIVRIALIASATAAALTAMLAVARVRTSLLFGITPTAVNFSDVVVAALLGGISLYGGTGRIERALVAVLFLAILTNGLLLLGLPATVGLIVKGVIFTITVITDALLHAPRDQ
ncbi:MAG: ABC transporter permease [Chloroflexi bacterium]|nr:ABC transporter permease [Chloroflexota bacterium]